MKIDETFYFGKYKNLSIKEVYQGTNNINRKLIKGFLKERIKTLEKNELNDTFFLEAFDFEISDSIIRAVPKLNDFKGNWANEIEKLFINRNNSWLDILLSNISIDDYNVKVYSIKKSKLEITSGNPEYIEWCIESIDNFYIEQHELKELQLLDIFRFKGIEIIHKIDDIYEYKPKYQVEKYRFPENVIAINENKNYSSANFDNDMDNDFDDVMNESTYENYSGSYAQDVEGWSDQDIDDALDGDPDAYWNID